MRRLTGNESLVSASPAILGAPRDLSRPGSTNGNGTVIRPSALSRRRVGSAPAAFSIDRMQVEDVSVSYGRKLAVNSVSLPIRQGEVLALIGPSGCGKTTLLRSLNRLTELTKSASLSGRITLDGVDIAGMEPTALGGA